jgi:rubredoxin
MKKWQCPCSYVYDPIEGIPDAAIAAGTAFEKLPENWTCPICGAPKSAFDEIYYPLLPQKRLRSCSL